MFSSGTIRLILHTCLCLNVIILLAELLALLYFLNQSKSVFHLEPCQSGTRMILLKPSSRTHQLTLPPVLQLVYTRGRWRWLISRRVNTLFRWRTSAPAHAKALAKQSLANPPTLMVTAESSCASVGSRWHDDDTNPKNLNLEPIPFLNGIHSCELCKIKLFLKASPKNEVSFSDIKLSVQYDVFKNIKKS